MKFIAISGSISNHSYNKNLLEYTKFKFNHIAEIDIVDISNIPIFNQDLSYKDYPKLIEISKKIEQSDGVIISTPEYNYTIPTILKSLLEWLSYELHPLKGKPILVLGASYSDQGSVNAQTHLKSILDSPGVDAYVVPGSEFLINNVKEKFDEDGFISDERTIDYLEHVLLRFVKYAELTKNLDITNLETTFTITQASGGYEKNDPYNDGTAGASEI